MVTGDGETVTWINPYGENPETAAPQVTASPNSGSLHIALTARSRAEVEAFYEAALEAGATDNGEPGLRPHYHENYYGAFVFDLDGNNLEAVCHKPA